MSNLNPDQFLFHGTAMDVEGDKLLPASVHGKGSYWDDTGEVRGEPANQYAWAHPSEHEAWGMADDRANYDLSNDDWGGHFPRSRVYAVHPNAHQSPGHDPSIPGEVKAPHFDIAQRIDTKPGHQGTFPDINWNEYAQKGGIALPGDEDANHPSHLSIQFGHRLGVWGEEAAHATLRRDAYDEADHRSWMREQSRTGGSDPFVPDEKDTPLPVRFGSAGRRQRRRFVGDQ